MDRSLVGTPLPETTIAVERGPVANFAKAVKDDNPVYADPQAAHRAGFPAIPVPPTYGFAMAHWGAFPELQPPSNGQPNPVMTALGALMSGGGLILHGEQEFRYHGRVVVGDILTGTGRISDISEKTGSGGATMTFVSAQNDYHNQRGEHVLTTVMTFIHRA